MPFEITYDTVLILAIFIIVVFLVYKAFKIAIRGILVGVAGFSFPWIAEYLNLGLPITPNIDIGIQFALLAISLFLIYEFSHTLITIIKIVSWPIRHFLRRRK
jgi:hypothetical protein